MKKLITLVTLTVMTSAFLLACGKSEVPTKTPETEEPQIIVDSNVDEDKTEVAPSSQDGYVYYSYEEPSDYNLKAEETVAYKLAEAFKKEAAGKGDTGAIAEYLGNESGIIDFGPAIESVSEGYLAGYSADITGFQSAYCIAPFIGSIPFMAYVFETDDPDALVNTLIENKDLRWNICTEANEMRVVTDGNFVFAVMSPFTFEE